MAVLGTTYAAVMYASAQMKRSAASTLQRVKYLGEALDRDCIQVVMDETRD